jgi:CDP-glucose 4,6-dehydratase
VGVLELVEQILELMGRPDLKPKILNQAKGEIPRQYLSSRRAKKLLGWQSRYGLEEGLREAIKWYQEYFDEKVSWL